MVTKRTKFILGILALFAVIGILVFVFGIGQTAYYSPKYPCLTHVRETSTGQVFSVQQQGLDYGSSDVESGEAVTFSQSNVEFRYHGCRMGRNGDGAFYSDLQYGEPFDAVAVSVPPVEIYVGAAGDPDRKTERISPDVSATCVATAKTGDTRLKCEIESVLAYDVPAGQKTQVWSIKPVNGGAVGPLLEVEVLKEGIECTSSQNTCSATESCVSNACVVKAGAGTTPLDSAAQTDSEPAESSNTQTDAAQTLPETSESSEAPKFSVGIATILIVLALVMVVAFVTLVLRRR